MTKSIAHHDHHTTFILLTALAFMATITEVAACEETCLESEAIKPEAITKLYNDLDVSANRIVQENTIEQLELIMENKYNGTFGDGADTLQLCKICLEISGEQTTISYWICRWETNDVQDMTRLNGSPQKPGGLRIYETTYQKLKAAISEDDPPIWL